eukprot:COSAG02_NODE_22460_length_752_cov_0.840735_1_plen_174_part_10
MGAEIGLGSTRTFLPATRFARSTFSGGKPRSSSMAGILEPSCCIVTHARTRTQPSPSMACPPLAMVMQELRSVSCVSGLYLDGYVSKLCLRGCEPQRSQQHRALHPTHHHRQQQQQAALALRGGEAGRQAGRQHLPGIEYSVHIIVRCRISRSPGCSCENKRWHALTVAGGVNG